MLQVELAQLEYLKSKLVRRWTHLERQRGAPGFVGGSGETQIESDRRAIDDRVMDLAINDEASCFAGRRRCGAPVLRRPPQAGTSILPCAPLGSRSARGCMPEQQAAPVKAWKSRRVVLFCHRRSATVQPDQKAVGPSGLIQPSCELAWSLAAVCPGPGSALSDIVVHLRSAGFNAGVRLVDNLSRFVNFTGLGLRTLSEEPRIVTEGRLAALQRRHAPSHSARRVERAQSQE